MNSSSFYKIAHATQLLSAVLRELKVDDVTPLVQLLIACVQTMVNPKQLLFETCILNVFKPLIVSNVLNYIYLLSSAINNFNSKLTN